ncbi:4-(cytidine 5'-diphospho)-2-C-methyl-D-erythritol kinase [Sinimarinibacterium sp. CAU 1509]|uniref:4-(cytidine 5'-diphospho)-2-C-methyl-D-erythritol kinase n=1 Tax=Sinimarinibacterium sp. CAU 1509 TaxID=2562283 RepID=UPI0010AD45F0|nr:4-(cytidine 5'-diphospho)-2-C-methyl-D-erythritol kinase [Sinimarinibacterium sp. CAU 1509]TJY61870.1 4-(cytidine 5'-diphospho)-2-C-methyl-D-erythritol kinase [Sinimarinibacterium sp. CAU 1509]
MPTNSLLRNAHGAFTADFPWPAPAKLNLFLHITGRRDDGYHQLQTVFQFLEFGDTLFISPRGDGKIVRADDLPGIAPEDDLALRAARLIQRASGCNLGADIRIEKRIPTGAGLGGGSSDAATTLVALNRLWNLGFTPDELAHLGLSIGADVPVFVRGQAAWAEGVGERLTPIALPEPWFVVLTPPVHVSTAEIFSATELQRDCTPLRADTFDLASTANVCELVTCARYPQVGAALAWLRRHGPARMSGTGASVFLACPTRAEASRIAAEASADNTLQAQAIVARGSNRSALRDAIAR